MFFDALEPRRFFSAATLIAAHGEGAAIENQPVVSIRSPNRAASEPGDNVAVFVVQRSGEALAEALSVNLRISGRAENGIDYESIGDTVIFGPGKRNLRIRITPIDDDDVEPVEGVRITLRTGDGYSIGLLNRETVRIADNDVVSIPPPSANITWTNAKASPIKRFEAPSAVIDGKVYVFGGWHWDNGAQVLRASQRVDVYDPQSNTWSSRASLPVKLTHAAVVVDGSKVYFIGGFVGDDPGAATDDIRIFDRASNTWSKPNFELPEARGAGGAALVGRRLHFFGGSMADRKTDSGKHWSINLDNTAGGWQSHGPLPNARHHFSTIALDGKIYVFGGQRSHDGTRNQDATVHVYDIASGNWSSLPNLPATLSHAEPGTFVRQGRIVIAGGMTDTEDRTPVNDLLEFDPATRTYRQLSPLPRGLTAPVAQLLPNGKLFVTGGSATPGGEQTASYIGTFA